MYHNKDNSTYSQYNKGKVGEQIFEQWCLKNDIECHKTTTKEDYMSKIDFITSLGKIAVKNNYNSHFGTVVVELEQLKDGPEAWINHDVDYFAFIVENNDVVLIKPKNLRKIDYTQFKNMDRTQGRFKGSYRIAFVPVEVIRQ